MKNLFLVIILYSFLDVKAQAPNSMSYQAVIRNSMNQVISNQNISIRLSILQGSETGISVFQETHQTTTNVNGLSSVIMGEGANQVGDFSSIDWASGPYFVKTETDPDGGTDYSIAGTSMLQSVPFALYAANAGSSQPGPQGIQGPQGPAGVQGEPGDLGPVGPVGPAGSGACDIIGNGNLLVAYTSSDVYGFSQSQSSIATNYNSASWASQSLSSPPLGAISSEMQIVIYTSENAYAFSQSQSSVGNPSNYNPGSWTTTSLSGTPLGAIATKRSIIIYTTTNIYAFSQSQSSVGTPPNLSNGTWTTQSLSGNFVAASASSRMAVILTDTNVYGFSQSQSSIGSPPSENTGTWSVQSIAGSPIDIQSTK
jgi:hypothetical protein